MLRDPGFRKLRWGNKYGRSIGPMSTGEGANKPAFI